MERTITLHVWLTDKLVMCERNMRFVWVWKLFFRPLFVPFLHSVLTYWILFIRPFSGLRSYFRMYSYSSYKSSSQRSLWAKIKGSFDNFFPYSAIFWEHFALLTVSSLGGMLVSGEYAYYFYKIVQWTMLFQTLEYFYW